MTKVIKYNTREEAIAAVKAAVNKKKAWEERAISNYVKDRERLNLPVLL